MASRARRLSECEGKPIYPDAWCAHHSAKWARRLYHEKVHAYRCSVCKRWHIGHVPELIPRRAR